MPITGLAYMWAVPSIEPGFGPAPPEEWPNYEATYNSSSEQLEITVKNHSFRKEHGQINISSNSGGKLDISNGEKTLNTNIWVKPSSIFQETEGVSSLPVNPGETITVISDGTDIDNDSTNGIENGERIVISYIKYPETIPPTRIVVSEDQAYVLKPWMTLELKKRMLNGTVDKLNS